MLLYKAVRINFNLKIFYIYIYEFIFIIYNVTKKKRIDHMI